MLAGSAKTALLDNNKIQIVVLDLDFLSNLLVYCGQLQRVTVTLACGACPVSHHLDIMTKFRPAACSLVQPGMSCCYRAVGSVTRVSTSIVEVTSASCFS